MHFKDLTSYTYAPAADAARLVNVGWLEGSHFYARGAVPEEFVDRLFAACRCPVNRMRGHHACTLCRVTDPLGVRVSRGGVVLLLGSAEIRIEGQAGRAYAAPDLVYHYVTQHRYLPPEEFVTAALGPSASSPPLL